MLEVVEDDESVGEHQGHVGQPERVGAGLAEGLDGAHEVVAEVADRAAGERTEVGQRELAVARDRGGRERIRVTAVGERPAQRRAGCDADEGVASDALSLVG